MIKQNSQRALEQQERELSELRLKDLQKIYTPIGGGQYEIIYNFTTISDFFPYAPHSPLHNVPAYVGDLINTDEYTLLYSLCNATIISSVNQCELSHRIIDFYGERKILNQYKEMIYRWDADVTDYMNITLKVKDAVFNVYYANLYKWCNLMKSCILEFNPLWNVDGIESTVRTLEQDGTETHTKTGTETDRTTGTETTEKTGTETTTKRGTVSDDTSDDYFEELDGSDAVAHTGTETTAYTGSEIDTLSGSDSVTQTGTVMHGTQKTTTESATFYDTEKVTDTYNTPTTTLYGKSDTKAFSNRSDTVTDNKTDTTTYGKKMTSSRTIDADTSYNTTDTLTHAVEDELTHDTTSTLTHNTSDALLRDLLDTERITKERHGNIGVTTTTSLLEEFRTYVDFNIMDIIAKDIVNAITEGGIRASNAPPP